MKFKIAPKWQQIPDQKLLEDLLRVAHLLGKGTVTKRDYVQHGTYDQQTVAKRFGSWFDALSHAGLSTDRPTPLSDEVCIRELKRVAAELGKDSLSLSEYRRIGLYSERPFIRLFGSWEEALKRAGLRPSTQFHKRVPDEEYFGNIERMWTLLGRQPRYTEIEKPFSAFSVRAYENRFGSWRKALEGFVAFINREENRAQGFEDDSRQSSSPLATSDPPKSSALQSRPRIRRTPRQPSDRLRFLVLRRDNFTCRSCGRSPALQPGLVLQIDHKLAWTKGGETVIENLQTLCEICNHGKGNLDSSEPNQGQ